MCGEAREGTMRGSPFQTETEKDYPMDALASLARTIRGIEFPYPALLAAGIVKTAEQVAKLADTDVIPEWGSIETQSSSGNGGLDYHAEYREVEGHRILLRTQNSLGLPNPGMEYVERHAPALIELYRSKGKPLILNISGKNVDDALSLLKRGLMCGFPVITVNGACPNKKDRPILCDDEEAVGELFKRADAEINPGNTLILWKVSCGMRRPALTANREAVITSKVFGGVITGNTLPSTFDLDEKGQPTIKTANGITRGGMAGPAIFPIALDHTAFMAETLPQNGKVVIGCGGIQVPGEIRKHFRVGASLVQLNSAYRESNENPRFMTDLIHGLVE